MNNKLDISIPNPCHENWEAMTTLEQVKQCGVCSTLVVDFTAMSDKEILNYLANKKQRVCGRLNANQMPTPQSRFNELSSKMKYFVFALAFVFFGFSSEVALSKSQLSPSHYTNSNSGSVKGKIINKEGKALDFVAVKAIQGGLNKGSCYTDETGNFTIKNLSPGAYKLEITYLGYPKVTIVDVEISAGGISVQNITMPEHIVMGLSTYTIPAEPVLDKSNPNKDELNQQEIRQILGGE